MVYKLGSSRVNEPAPTLEMIRFIKKLVAVPSLVILIAEHNIGKASDDETMELRPPYGHWIILTGSALSDKSVAGCA